MEYNEKIIKSFIKLAKDEGATELKYENKDLKLSVSFETEKLNSILSSNFERPHVTRPAQENTSSHQKVNEGENNAKKSEMSAHLAEIKSPLVGTFYSSASPQKPPFVKIGDKVSKGQTLCIIEAMKIMNEVESDCSGEIVEIFLENENIVEYGQVLFRIKKS
jgi:acetyl-CoA carboxylase biotin carboxyl carrier protein